MSYSLRFGGFNAPARPSVSTRAVQKNPGPVAGSGSGSVAPAPAAPSGGLPLWALPALAVAAAAPIYGFKKNQREIAAARAAYEKKQAAAAAVAVKKA